MITKGTAKYTCYHCKIEFFDSPSHPRKYCSRACVNKAAKEIWSPTFATVRKNMLKRKMLDQCERCGYKEHTEILGVHHKDRNPRNNALENLEVLCPMCHSLEHRKHIAHGFKE
jgi:5-methylcytosine-specific restriction protein A